MGTGEHSLKRSGIYSFSLNKQNISINTSNLKNIHVLNIGLYFNDKKILRCYLFFEILMINNHIDNCKIIKLSITNDYSFQL